ncbi:hypothetical protein [Catellatospora vulcania]|uniref:hypothetical protein n=1 Tax=Catellatospora vulcania TaxID=1460450 RepID=UPI0012D447DD|nr:hypothetical protein [Catellatospora vulcania]
MAYCATGYGRFRAVAICEYTAYVHPGGSWTERHAGSWRDRPTQLSAYATCQNSDLPAVWSLIGTSYEVAN